MLILNDFNGRLEELNPCQKQLAGWRWGEGGGGNPAPGRVQN